ncbi:MAG: cupin domain-containing protein [Phycisphaera sp.]|nr:MAG: cupin domain-containing protein [Phycisphaera sp.]
MIRNIDEVQMNDVQMEGVEGAQMAVMVGRSDGAPNFALRSFSVAPGGHTPRHSHDFEHEVYVVSGGGTVLLGEKQHTIKAGDVIYVEAELEHQFKSGDAELRFLCMVPVERNCGEPTPGSE